MPDIMKLVAGAPLIGIVEMTDMTKEHHNTRSENFNKVISMANNRYLLDGFEMDIGESTQKCSIIVYGKECMFRRSEFRTSSLKRCVIPSCLRIRYPHEHLHYNKNPRTHRILWHNGFTALVLKLLNPDIPFIQFIVSTSNV
jgi:hypothetical protein